MTTPLQAPSPAPTRAPPLNLADNVSYLLQMADEAMRQGENADRVAAQLGQNGMTEDQWPESLRTALARQKQNQSYTFGLGR
ncbi:hypothetical protein ACCT28_36245 [Rhizobium ruizarguesonis]